MTSSPDSLVASAIRRRVKRLRQAGATIFLMGLAGAGTVLWLGSRAPDESDNPDLVALHRPEERQLGILYGKQGRLVDDLDTALARPRTQAILLAAAVLTAAAGCFYFARIMETDAQTKTIPPTKPGES